jgi:hypothetical protein
MLSIYQAIGDRLGDWISDEATRRSASTARATVPIVRQSQEYRPIHGPSLASFLPHPPRTGARTVSASCFTMEVPACAGGVLLRIIFRRIPEIASRHDSANPCRSGERVLRFDAVGPANSEMTAVPVKPRRDHRRP